MVVFFVLNFVFQRCRERLGGVFYVLELHTCSTFWANTHLLAARWFSLVDMVSSHSTCVITFLMSVFWFPAWALICSSSSPLVTIAMINTQHSPCKTSSQPQLNSELLCLTSLLSFYQWHCALPVSHAHVSYPDPFTPIPVCLVK